MVSRPPPLDGDPAEIANALRLRLGSHGAWLFATDEIDQAAAAGDAEAVVFWSGVFRCLGGFEK